MNEIRREAEIECGSPLPPRSDAEICVNEGREHLEKGKLAPAEERARKALHINSGYEPAERLLKDIKKGYYDQGLKIS